MDKGKRVAVIATEVMVQDPVDAHELFAAARAAVGAPDAEWDRVDSEEVRLLQTARDDQGAAAVVSVQFAADGGQYPVGIDGETVMPDGYVSVGFEALGLFGLSATDAYSDVNRINHQRIVTALGAWLNDRDLCWSWRHEGEPWVVGNLCHAHR